MPDGKHILLGVLFEPHFFKPVSLIQTDVPVFAKSFSNFCVALVDFFS